MQTNIITYLCFFVVCGLVVLDMVFYSSVLLQIVCIVLALLVVGLTAYIAHEWHNGSYTTTEQQNSYQAYLSENIALQNELAHIKQTQQKSKGTANEVQQTILTNSRLTAQNSNLKAHIQTLTEQLQTAKNSKQTAVVPITPNEQKQTASNIKKSKTA